MSKKKKYRGHFCWSCSRILPNERFSGRGHRLHLCKKCKRLGKEELAFRQCQRDIDRLIDWEGRIRRKRKHVFLRYLNHKDERVRVYAETVNAHIERHRQEARDLYLAQREDEERMLALYEESEDNQDPDDDDGDIPTDDPDLEEIPF